MLSHSLKKLFISSVAISALISSSAMATVVIFNTSHGDIEVNLFDQTTPITVENFLGYVNDGSYDNTVIHRSIKGFITQGGGFRFEGELPLTRVANKAAIQNEPVYSSRRGTIAMAKLSDNENSATNQWFFNLANNSANLDIQNGGFTVFGQITDEGMKVVDLIADLPTCSETPMPNIDCSNIGTPGVENFVTITNVTITDTSITSASGLSPRENALIKVKDKVKESSGGSFHWFLLLPLALLRSFKKKKIN